jgi:plasmid stability protein
MKRTLVQFDEDTYRKLRERAFRQQRSMSSLVREMVANGLDNAAKQGRRKRLSQFLSVGAGRSKQGRSAPVSEKHDEALAKAFAK